MTQLAWARVCVLVLMTVAGATAASAQTRVLVRGDKQAAIFEPFVQLGRTLTSPHEGTGLGLAISRDLARAMGGDVTVVSEGKGSTFRLTLPRANDD